MKVPAILVEDESTVATKTVYCRALIARRSTMLSLFAVACVCSAAESRAGVIVPWTQESRAQGQARDQSEGIIDLALPGSGSSSATQLPVSERSEKHDRDQTA